jgi:hypothetical protein
MTGEIVWRGASSQWKNFGVYLLCGLGAPKRRFRVTAKANKNHSL